MHHLVLIIGTSLTLSIGAMQVASKPTEKQIYDTMRSGQEAQFLEQVATGANMDFGFTWTTLKQTPLIRATEINWEQAVQALLEKKVNVNSADDQGKTALFYAVVNNKPKLIGMLVKHNATIDHQNNDGNTPLHQAILMNKLDAAKELLRQGAKTDIKNASNQTAFQMAAQIGSPELIKHIITLAKQRPTMETIQEMKALVEAKKEKQEKSITPPITQIAESKATIEYLENIIKTGNIPTEQEAAVVSSSSAPAEKKGRFLSWLNW